MLTLSFGSLLVMRTHWVDARVAHVIVEVCGLVCFWCGLVGGFCVVSLGLVCFVYTKKEKKSEKKKKN